MSSIFVVRSAQAIWMLTDGASVDAATGKLGRIGTKVTALPHLPAAISHRGNVEVGLGLNIWLESPQVPMIDFDEFLVTFPEFVRQCPTINKRLAQEFVVAGYSRQRARFEAYGIYSDGTALDGRAVAYGGKPCEMIEQPDVFGAPWPAPDLMAEFGLEPMTTFNPYTQGLGAVHAQRRQAIREHPAFGLVGGFAMVTTITMNGVSSEILQRFPDKIGERIQVAS